MSTWTYMRAHNLIVFALFALTILIWIGVDVYLAMDGGADAMISFIFYKWAKQWPVLPFAIGVLMGHFFWPVKRID